MKHANATRIVSLGLFALTAACAEAPAAAAQGGTFRAQLTGAADATLEGYAPSSSRPGVAWTLQMETPGGDNDITMLREGAGRPDPGTYALVDVTTKMGNAASGDIVVAVRLHDSVLPGGGFDTVRGTLTVTASSEASVEGEFTLTAHHSTNPDRSVVVTGTFKSHNRPM